MKNLVPTIKIFTVIAVLMSVSACISVKREAEPTTSVTTTSATVSPASTTRVERTTTY